VPTLPESEDEFLAFEEHDRFLKAAAPEWNPLLLVALEAGLRVGELLGHESIERTLRHPHLSPDVKREAVRRLD
jgi:hypothetical protein